MSTRPTVILYTKPGCHLCEPVAATIAAAARLRSFHSVSRNILDSAEEFERYQHAIPVVTVNGVEVARYRLSLPQLIGALDHAVAGGA